MDKVTLLNLRTFIAPEIVYGPGALALAGRHSGNLGATRVMLVTDPGVQEAGWARKVEASLKEAGISYVVYNNVTSNPKDREIMAGAEISLREGCNLVLAVGGGSPMDCAKGIGVVMGNERPIIDFEGVDAIPKPGPPLIFIPTTAGSSADISQFAIITDTTRKAKIAIISKMVIPDISLVDPETSVTMPPDLTAATGMDALCHAFEAYVSSAASPLTDMAALRAVRLVTGNLTGAYDNPSNMKYRENMMMASLMAGLAFSNASLGLVHAMAHSLGGYLDLTHGECNAILLEKVVRFNYTAIRRKYAELADAMGIENAPRHGDVASGLVERISALRKRVGINERLRDLGVGRGDLPALAAQAQQDPCLSTNPRSATAAEIEQILDEVF